MARVREKLEVTNIETLPDGAFVTGMELASWLNVGKATIWRRVADGTLPRGRKFGGCTRYRVGEVRAALAKAGV
jgi:predicted DNA-binding transcriptional regulator AlpA